MPVAKLTEELRDQWVDLFVTSGMDHRDALWFVLATESGAGSGDLLTAVLQMSLNAARAVSGGLIVSPDMARLNNRFEPPPVRRARWVDLGGDGMVYYLDDPKRLLAVYVSSLVDGWRWQYLGYGGIYHECPGFPDRDTAMKAAEDWIRSTFLEVVRDVSNGRVVE